MKINGFVIRFLDDGGKVAATGDNVFGPTVDFFLKREDAEFAARTAHHGRRLEVRRATIDVPVGDGR